MNPKEAAGKLLAKAVAANVRFPKIWEETEKTRTCGAEVMMSKSDDGSFDLDAALASLIEKYGTEEKITGKKKKKEDVIDLEDEDNEESEKKKKVKKSDTVACEENREIAAIIKEMADVYFQNKDARKGGVFSKAAKAIRECETEISSEKEAVKLPGIGKSIGAYVQEFLNTGCITKLEELRAGTA